MLFTGMFLHMLVNSCTDTVVHFCLPCGSSLLGKRLIVSLSIMMRLWVRIMIRV
mgnify:CR=1 FL=1